VDVTFREKNWEPRLMTQERLSESSFEARERISTKRTDKKRRRWVKEKNRGRGQKNLLVRSVFAA